MNDIDFTPDFGWEALDKPEEVIPSDAENDPTDAHRHGDSHFKFPECQENAEAVREGQ
jgi:hypothetical protein